MECLSAPPLLLCEWGSWLSAHVRFYELSCTSPALWHLYSSTPTGMAAPAGGGGLCIYDNSADIGTTPSGHSAQSQTGLRASKAVQSQKQRNVMRAHPHLAVCRRPEWPNDGLACASPGADGEPVLGARPGPCTEPGDALESEHLLCEGLERSGVSR